MSDELADALRELAAQHEVPPSVGAAEVRDRARRRSLRRRAGAALGTAAAAVCVLTAVAFTLHTGDPGRNGRTPAAAPEASTPAPSAASPAPAPVGVLDLGRHTLTVGKRVVRVDPHAFPRFPSGSRMTVVAKDATRTLRLESGIESGAEIKVPYLVELRAPGRQPVYAGALAFDTKALAVLSAGTGWLGMSHTDAEWFYTWAREGDRIEITSTVPLSPAATPTAPARVETPTAPTASTRAETTAGAPVVADRAGTPGAVGGTDD
ncbi:hypothetical protein AB0A94_17165 [Streptomyces sp. NPDC044984]|uniref:hypothetical protein n=1 Tax=Streptomyces sp. NPDC044984 TaxID=3154335 RepID=UPI0033E98AD9